MQTNYVGEIAGSRKHILVAPCSQADIPHTPPPTFTPTRVD